MLESIFTSIYGRTCGDDITPVDPPVSEVRVLQFSDDTVLQFSGNAILIFEE